MPFFSPDVPKQKAAYEDSKRWRDSLNLALARSTIGFGDLSEIILCAQLLAKDKSNNKATRIKLINGLFLKYVNGILVLDFEE